MSTVRQRIISIATSLAGNGARKPSPAELRQFFATAKAEAVPSVEDAKRSLDSLTDGCYVQGVVKHWCGIFATAVAVQAGLCARWKLNGGQIVGLRKVWGYRGIQPGDVAVIAQNSHHFVITGIPIEGIVETVEGNAGKQMIRRSKRSMKSIVAYYQSGLPDAAQESLQNK